MDEFLAMLAHELRNPLAPLRTTHEVSVRLHGAGFRVRSKQLGRARSRLTRSVRSAETGTGFTGHADSPLLGVQEGP
ncbi:histidine kinase dimerization/phospho-acceptor domain-containing protein [Caballeronia sp. BCC1704]|uniref:histidine kinase dimerization/phospho-acceptor domain-containing protein n=1 Tax=Caballeronia sp. BCC1704 TaxID=2676300 RepID=UPI00158E8846|nr:histidine kinase dimerization/phospho-acceptor domain-containing protein [Caballeronia sp. BCC1704]